MRDLTRKFNIVLALAVVTLLVGNTFGKFVVEDNNPHDFGRYGWSGGQSCGPCHTPHNGNIEMDHAPMWAHELSTATYTMHAGSGDPATDIDQLSRLCLSCHDGTVALASFTGTTSADTSKMGDVKASASFGTDLTNDHPIGAAAIWEDVTGETNVGGVWQADQSATRWVSQSNWSLSYKDPMVFEMPAGDFAGKHSVSCMSCHSAHSASIKLGVSGSGTTIDGRNINGSKLCLSCHVK